jgi:DNA-binding transcriptional LysR family regulator
MGDRRLQVFHALAQHRSFLRAAEALFMSQSAVHFQIRQLEAELNTRLLERGKGVLDLTPSGRIAFGYAERILALSREMETRLTEMTDDMRGALRVGASSGIGDQLLPALLAEFSGLYPQVTVQLHIANSTSVAEGVAAGDWDLGLVALPGQRPGLGVVDVEVQGARLLDEGRDGRQEVEVVGADREGHLRQFRAVALPVDLHVRHGPNRPVRSTGTSAATVRP